MERAQVHNIKFSVITVCRNAENSIEKTIQSVLSQTYANIEYIIIDGASTDSTIIIVNKYSSRIATIISEPDSGIYDAMNKGADKATGDILCFINAGDYYLDDSIFSNVAEIISARPSVDVFHAKTLMYDSKQFWSMIFENEKLDKFNLFLHTPPHPSTFFTKRSIAAAGKYDTSFKICADYEWYLRSVIDYGHKYFFVPCVTTVFNLDGVSSLNPDQREKEFVRAVKLHFTGFEIFVFYTRGMLKGLFAAVFKRDLFLIKYLARHTKDFFS